MYQALYRKYRPQTFDEVVGQKSVTQTLKAQLSTGKLSHAYLFTGSRGTGKTSCAKILAKAVNCLHPEGGNPCNRCEACLSIDSGSCMDVLEIDAASNNGVDNVRSLRDDAIYAPAEVKKRVYIIDEVHMLSISAFNALLKIIEEPPEHLLFILATTELHKVPATILSRCQRFSFRRLLPEDIAGRINYVAYQEGIDLSEDAALLLARLADGALRDGLSLLDQCAASGGTVDVQRVYDCLGLAGSQKAAEMLGHIARHDAKAALSLFASQYAGGKDLAAMLDELVALSRDLLVLKTAPKTGKSLLTGVCTDQEYKTLYPLLTGAELLRITSMLQQTASGFNRSANRRIDTELCLLQLCDPQLNLDAQALSARISKLEQQLASGKLVVEAAPEPEKEETALQAPAPKKTEPEPFAMPELQLEELPVGFWPDVVAAVSTQLDPAEASLFSTKSDAVLRPLLKDGVLLLCADSEFVKQRIDNSRIRQIVTAAAEARLKTRIRVKVVCSPREDDSGDHFAALLAFAEQHKDIINIQK